MRTVGALGLAAFVLVLCAMIIQYPWAERAEAASRRADCFGFGATDTDDLAYVTIWNPSSGEPVDVRVTFFRGDGTRTPGSPQTGTVEPDTVVSFKEFFSVESPRGPAKWLQRARVDVTSGKGNIKIDAAVFHDTGSSRVTERQVACEG